MTTTTTKPMKAYLEELESQYIDARLEYWKAGRKLRDIEKTMEKVFEISPRKEIQSNTDKKKGDTK